MLAFLLVSVSYGSDRSTLWGSVTDNNNQPLQNVKLKLFENGKDKGISTLSDKNGDFQFIGIQPGFYALCINKEGYNPLFKNKFVLEPGQSRNAKVILTAISDETPSSLVIRNIDYSNNTYQTVLDENHIYNLPSAHNVWHLVENQDLSATSGRIDVGGLWGNIPAALSSRGGISWTQTEYRLNGMDVTDPYQSGIPLFHPDFFSLQFTQMTNGAHPIDVLTPGGAFNLITRKGYNNFNGSAQVYYIHSLFQSNNISDALRSEDLYESHSFNSMLNGNFNVSGPLIQNKLYFFSSLTANNLNRNMAEFEEDDKSSLLSGLFSLNYQSGDHDLKLLWTGQIVSHDSFGANRKIPFSSTTLNKDYFNVLQAIWNFRLSYNHSFNLGASYSQGNLNSDFQEGNILQHGIEIFKKIPSGTAPFSAHNSRRLFTLVLSGNSIFNVDRGMRHNLNYGIELKKSSFSSQTDIYNGTHLRFFGNDPLEVVFYNTPSLSEGTGFNLNAFVQNTINFPGLFSVSLGTQIAYARSRIPGITDLNSPSISWFNLSPRLGLTIPLNKSKNAALKFSLSRYYFSLPLSYMLYGNPKALGGMAYKWNDINNDGQFQAGERSTLLRREGPLFSTIDQNLKRPFTDEISISYHKSWGKGWSFMIGGFFRENKNLVETLNTGVPLSSYTPSEFYDIGDDREANTHDDLQFTVYNQNPDSFGQDFYLLTNNVGENRFGKYFGADMSLIKRYGKNLTFFISLTATEANGTTNPGNSEYENDEGIIGPIFDSPNNSINARGRVRFDRAYTGRLGVNYVMPGGFRLACVVKYYDGQPFARKIIVTGMNQGPFFIQAHPRGVSRYEYNRTIEIRIEKTFRFDTGKFRIILDAFNFINRGLATKENEWTRPEYGLRYATEIQSPRVFRLGLAYDF